MAELRYNVFGRIVLVRREGPEWRTLSVGADGKRAPAGFEIPDFLGEDEIEFWHGLDEGFSGRRPLPF
jgi:hypothetical protein